MNDLVGPRLLGVECADIMLLIAATELAPTEAFSDLRYRGVYSEFPVSCLWRFFIRQNLACDAATNGLHVSVDAPDLLLVIN